MKNPFDLFSIEKMMKMLDEMPAEQKEALENMAMDYIAANPSFDPLQAASLFNQNPTEEEIWSEKGTEAQDLDLSSFGLSSQEAGRLNEEAADLLDTAIQLETFLEEDDKADYSIVWLPVLKALLFTLRQADENRNLLFEQPLHHGLNEFLWNENLFALLPELAEDTALKNLLSLSHSKADSGWISREEYEFYKGELVRSALFNALAAVLNRKSSTNSQAEEDTVLES